MIQTVLQEHPDLRQFLFCRGFLLTNRRGIPAEDFPFYGAWNRTDLDSVCVWTHPQTDFHHIRRGERVFFLLGHAYNPFTMETDEDAILAQISEHRQAPELYEALDELTGIFVFGFLERDRLVFVADPAGIQSACYGYVDGEFYLTSHPQLVADLCSLQMDPFVARLIRYKWYPRVMGAYLPADLTPFADLKRVVPNQTFTAGLTEKSVTHQRFYPLRPIKQCKTKADYERVITEAAEILRRNMELVTRKWECPWISLTGGIDSNTTFAAANGYYDRVQSFSYLSAPKERIDCEAAQKIASRFSVPWTLYEIPDQAEMLDRFAEKAQILRHNNGYIACERDNELRKRVYLQSNCPADVEVKSWVSETIRGYWYKYLGRKTMPKLSPKLFRSLYKIFIFNRRLAHKIDVVFNDYIESFEYCRVPKQYPPADMHYHEVGWGSWGSLNISEMKFCFDITIIYNNRRFLDLLFRVPLEQRISDQHHLDMKKLLNRELYDMNIRVVNEKETAFRAFALNAIFSINSILPF